ncbi:MAG TPA: aspartate--tRNA(Asn) ligase [Solirubrobacteraceae bacterium]|jgi:nondiscriminating aspartyl-tRNA synthetase|nr:aspartate--tRNA(Asn) ligase [Solirubrobacteraceae bacterium]
MTRTLIAELPDKIGERVRIRGWMHAIRDQKRMQFLIVRDETGLVQVVVPKEEPPIELNEAVSALTVESAVTITGTVVADERVKLGGLEVKLETLEVDSLAEPEVPIAPDSALDKRIDWRYLDLRRLDRRLIFEVDTTVEQAMREYWRKERFIELHTPKLMGSASESGAELFKVEYFDEVAYLAQSPQFYKQMAMAAGFGKVFEVGPVFRANPSFTSRHDTEFTSVDVEISWIDSHEDVMAFEERWLAYVLAAVKDTHGEQIASTFGVELEVPSVPFPKVTLEQAKELLREAGHDAPGPGHDLDPPSERALSAIVKEQHGHEFTFVTDYPTTVRPFYHMRHTEDPTLTKSFDLLWRGIELTTGAQREHRYEQLLAQANDKGVEVDSIQYYLDFFRFGAPPHGGFGFGLTRLLMQMLGQENVREVTFLYRGPHRLTP